MDLLDDFNLNLKALDDNKGITKDTLDTFDVDTSISTAQYKIAIVEAHRHKINKSYHKSEYYKYKLPYCSNNARVS